MWCPILVLSRAFYQNKFMSAKRFTVVSLRFFKLELHVNLAFVKRSDDGSEKLVLLKNNKVWHVKYEVFRLPDVKCYFSSGD